MDVVTCRLRFYTHTGPWALWFRAERNTGNKSERRNSRIKSCIITHSKALDFTSKMEFSGHNPISMRTRERLANIAGLRIASDQNLGGIMADVNATSLLKLTRCINILFCVKVLEGKSASNESTQNADNASLNVESGTAGS